MRNLKQSTTVFEGLRTQINQMAEHGRLDLWSLSPCTPGLTYVKMTLSRSLVRDRRQDLRSCATHVVKALG